MIRLLVFCVAGLIAGSMPMMGAEKLIRNSCMAALVAVLHATTIDLHFLLIKYSQI